MTLSKTPNWWPLAREITLFAIGAIGVLWETFHGPVNPSLLILFGAMMGIPIMLHKDKP